MMKFEEMMKQDGTLEYMMHDDVLTMSLSGVIIPDQMNDKGEVMKESQTSARHFREILNQHPSAKEIVLFINSPGGVVEEGNLIYDMLSSFPGRITAKIRSSAYSMASLIAMAADQVIMSPVAMMMLHHPYATVQGNFKELRDYADRMEERSEAAKTAYLLKAGGKLTKEKLTDLMDHESFLSAETCFELGLCDEVEGMDLKHTKPANENIQGNEPSDEGWFF